MGVVHVNVSEYSASAMVILDHTCAVINLTLINNGGGSYWYVNRVRVPEKHRFKGIGTRMMLEIQKQIDCPMIVEPGGYGFEPEEIAKWYRKQGFIDVPNAECLTLKWSPKK